jgi:hypothetical protein
MPARRFYEVPMYLCRVCWESAVACRQVTLCWSWQHCKMPTPGEAACAAPRCVLHLMPTRQFGGDLERPRAVVMHL